MIDGESFKETAFIKTGKGTHGIYPSRDGQITTGEPAHVDVDASSAEAGDHHPDVALLALEEALRS